jgi:hypothetical protein
MSARVAGVCAALALASSALLLAEDAHAGPPAWWVRRRSFGVGLALAAGASYNVVPSLDPPAVVWGPQASLPSLELRWGLPNDALVHVYSQLGNTLLSGILAASRTDPNAPGELVFASLGALYDFNLPLGDWPGFHRRRLVLAPGLELGGDLGFGGSFERTRPAKVALRIPVRVGVEWLLGPRPIGLSLTLRSFFEVAGWARNNGRESVTQGFASLVECGLIFY